MDPVSIALGIGSLILPLFGGGGDKSAGVPPEVQKQLEEMLKFQTARMQNMDPLQQAIVAMAMGRLPTRYQQPVSWGATPQPGAFTRQRNEAAVPTGTEPITGVIGSQGRRSGGGYMGPEGYDEIIRRRARPEEGW